MATKSQRKAQRAKRQDKKRQKERNREKTGRDQTITRLKSRLSRQTPRAWQGELPEDASICDDSILESLAPDLADQARLVRRSLHALCQNDGTDAMSPLATISRTSRFAPWRLFIRGLVAWREGDLQTAESNWERLDSERRPGRIAAAMMLAHRTDLETLSQRCKQPAPDPANLDQAANQPNDNCHWLKSLDGELLYHAKLIRRIQIDRASIRIARTVLAMHDEDPELVISPNRIQWLREFSKHHEVFEPEFVQALQRVAIGRAFCSRYVNIFADTIRHFEGPRHDRKNSLLKFFYYSMDRDKRSQQISQQALNTYLKVDLPNNRELSDSLRSALISQVHLNEATSSLRPNTAETGLFGMLSVMFDDNDESETAKHFEQSIAAWPTNQLAYQAYADWIESKLDEDRLTNAEREPLEVWLAEVHSKWCHAIPEDIQPRLSLVDYLFDNERSEEAAPHIEFLAGTRQESPLARAMPWKWNLLEAMRLCRRKTWFAEVSARLDEAESTWPAWLSKSYLPYLRAAFMLRRGDADGFAMQRKQCAEISNVSTGSLVDACMMLGAAQQMRVPSAELKSLRQPIDAAVANLGGLALEDLLATCGFFWDLCRARLLYPAYRSHGKKLLKNLLQRWNKQPRLVTKELDHPQVRSALFLMADQGLLSNGYGDLPKWMTQKTNASHPTIIAASFRATVNGYSVRASDEQIQLLRGAAGAERDPYYQFWFQSLADEMEDAVRNLQSSPFGNMNFGAMFNSVFSSMDGDSDEPCDCDACRAQRGDT